MQDINGKEIKAGMTVKTRQYPNGIMPPGKPEIGIAEDTFDAFGKPSMHIRYRKEGTDFDRFILLDGKINEIINH